MEDFSQQEYLDRLRTLVNTDGSSYDPQGVDRVAETLARWYEDLGLHVKKHRFDPRAGQCLEIRTHPEEEDIDILFSGHMDTVFPKGTADRRGFTMDEEQACGPGVIDMKSGQVSIFFVVRALHALRPNLRLCMALNSDEEISSRYSAPWLSELGTHARCGLVFEGARASGNPVGTRKGVGPFRVELAGKAAHAGVDPKAGANTIHEAARWITRLAALNDEDQGTTVNVDVIQGGFTTNVIPDKCSFQVDTRFLKPDAYRTIVSVLEDLEAHPQVPGVTASITSLGYRPPMIPGDAAKAMMAVYVEEARAMGMDLTFVTTGGGSDGNLLSFAGCPVMDGMGPIGGNGHTDREYLVLSSIVPRLQLALRTLLRLADEGLLRRE